MSQKQGPDAPPDTADNPAPTTDVASGLSVRNSADGIDFLGDLSANADVPKLAPHPVPPSRLPDADTANIADPGRFKLLEGAAKHMPENKETAVEENFFSTAELDAVSDTYAAQLRPANTARGYAGTGRCGKSSRLHMKFR